MMSYAQKLLSIEALDVDAADFATFGLTAREQEIAKWICCGKTNWEIGKILGISIYTVKVHIRSILRKMGAENRLQVIITALVSRDARQVTC